MPFADLAQRAIRLCHRGVGGSGGAYLVRPKLFGPFATYTEYLCLLMFLIAAAVSGAMLGMAGAPLPFYNSYMLGRALMAEPEIVLVDEPSVGLSPILVRQRMDAVSDLERRPGIAVLIAEQNLAQAIRIVDRGYVLAQGRVAFEGRSAGELSDSEIVKDIDLGR